MPAFHIADMLFSQLAFARVELDMSVHWIREIAKLELPEEHIVKGDKEIVTRYVPLGVSVGLIPWNYPVLLAVGKITPALTSGNTIIIKPSPFTPACGLKLVELGQRFFPPGVLQALSGDDDLGPMLTSHPIPAKISFTGSTITGKKVMESASKTLKRVTLELYVVLTSYKQSLILTCNCSGGNDPAVVFEDVDIDYVAQKVAELAFLNSGQVCKEKCLFRASFSSTFLTLAFPDLSRTEADIRPRIHCPEISPCPCERHEEPKGKKYLMFNTTSKPAKNV